MPEAILTVKMTKEEAQALLQAGRDACVSGTMEDSAPLAWVLSRVNKALRGQIETEFRCGYETIGLACDLPKGHRGIHSHGVA